MDANGNIDISDALLSLEPDSVFVVRGEEIEWLNKDVTQPTEAEIDAEVIRLQAEYDAQEYARNRQAEYPDWGTQLNKIYDDGLAKWKSEMVDPIKAKYPKGE
jgi:hypothetical protein